MPDTPYGPVSIAPDFWSRADVSRALTSRDIGELFRLLTQRAGLSQTRIGAATGLAQGRVSQIVHGKYQVRTIDSLARIADGLTMPGHARAALGLAPQPRSGYGDPAPAGPDAQHSHLPVPGTGYPATTEQAVAAAAQLWQADDARSREVLSAPLDSAAWNAAALAWLVSQLDTMPGSGDETGRAVGHSDVARVRASTALLAEMDNRFGGAHARRSLIRFLGRDAAVLLAGRYTDDVGRDLFSAVAEATLLAGWTSYDCGLHGLAQRYLIQALRLAQSAGDRRLACSTLSAMSHQATYLGHLPEAVNLARAAHGGLRGDATPALSAQFLAMEARALARSRDTSGCHAALAAAERAFDVPQPGRDPEFIAYFNEAELSAEIAHCFRDLADSRRAAEHAARAVPSDGRYARSDFFVTMVLADAHADAGEPDQACATALTALSLAETLTSTRCVTYVREFRSRLARFGDDPAVRDFTEQAADHAMWIKAA